MPVLTQAPTQEEAPAAAPSPVVPFVKGAQEQRVPTEADESLLITAASRQVGSFELPATGWLRSVIVRVEATGGTGAVAVAAADAPWNVIDSIVLTDPAGNEIFGPLSGYELYLANKYGGYAFGGHPKDSPAFTNVAVTGDFEFLLRVPVEASLRDGYGSLPNQDSSAAYRLRIVQADSASIYTTNPTTLPTVRYRAWAEVWTQPTSEDLAGVPQAQMPPGVGTTQFWTREQHNVPAGNSQPRIRRVGNHLRTLIVVHRNAAGARVANLANLAPSLYWDGLALLDEDLDLRRHAMFEEFGYTEAEIDEDAGVLVYSFGHDLDGKHGQEMRNGLLPTTKATNLQYRALFAVGSATFLINDVQKVGLA